MFRFVPQITDNNIFMFNENTKDYLLDIDLHPQEDILNYNDVIPRLEFVDKNNSIESLGFDILNKCLDNSFYFIEFKEMNDTLLSSFLYSTLSKFSMMSPVEKNNYLKGFKTQMGLNLDEQQLLRKLGFTKMKIKKLELQSVLFDNKNTDNNSNFITYLVYLFKINIMILNSDSFQFIKYNDDRKVMILIYADNNFKLLCKKDSDINLFNNETTDMIIKQYLDNIVKIKDAYDYKIIDLKEIAKKFNINLNSKTKKDDIYNEISKFFNLEV
jgi:hypothetical protein